MLAEYVGELMLFGGAIACPRGTDFSDTWAFDGVTWTQRRPARSPPARSAFAIACDARQRVAVLYEDASVRNLMMVFRGDAWT